MSSLPRLANELWRLANLERHRRFARALADPERAQADALRSILQANAGCEFGRRHAFAALRSPREFQARVPLGAYEERAAEIDRIRAGESGVLTARRVQRLIPSSGSTSARKLLPCTHELMAEFRRAIGPWIVDLFTREGLRRGRAYWSISPALEADRSSSIPIGFADDSEYLGRWLRPLVRHALVGGDEVARIDAPDAFRYTVLLLLLQAHDLTLVSVWHPSFLTLLLRALPAHWERLIDDLRRGEYRPPATVPPWTAKALARRMRPRARRADELAACGPRALPALWPRLRLISCWGDGPARGALQELRDLLPGVEIQPKGLVATEAFVSLPFRDAHPLAIRSHFFEFLDDTGRARRVEELEQGAEYSVVVTTSGGLYRYPLRDRVRIDGFLERTPSLSFLGKDQGITDLRGEKLSDSFVAGALRGLFAAAELEPSFAMLAPTRRAAPPRYTLFVESARDLPADLALRLEARLEEDPHYLWCIRLGQLAPSEVLRVAGGAHAAYCERLRLQGRKLGDIKPVSLSALDDWEPWLGGVPVQGTAQPVH